MDERRREREPLDAFSEVDAADVAPDRVPREAAEMEREAKFEDPHQKLEDL